MASATKVAKSRGGSEGGELLKGSHLPKNKNEVVIFINSVREAPEEWSGPFVFDIDEVYGCTAFAPNKTTIKELVRLIGDETDDWPGHEVTLSRVRVNNPTTKQPAWGLTATSVKKTKRKPKATEVPF